jgi:hypothetical protein
MLIFRSRRAVIIRIPSLALLLAGLWVIVQAAALAGGPHEARITGGFAVAVSAVIALGTRIVRRAGDEIVSSGLLGSRYVPARHASLGIRMRGGGRYWSLALDLMVRPDFGSPDAVTIDTFEANGTGAIIRAGRRAAGLLGLPEPILAPGLSDGASRTADHPDGADVGKRFDLRRRWTAASAWTKFLALVVLSSVTWMVFARRPGGQLLLICAKSWQVRDPSPTFNLTCVGRTVVDVDAGPATLRVWDPGRSCWIERRFVVPEHRRVAVHVDDEVKVSSCASAGWPPPS